MTFPFTPGIRRVRLLAAAIAVGLPLSLFMWSIGSQPAEAAPTDHICVYCWHTIACSLGQHTAEVSPDDGDGGDDSFLDEHGCSSLDCVDEHGECTPVEGRPGIDLVVVETALERGDAKALTNMLTEHPTDIWYNPVRKAIQVRGCKGEDAVRAHYSVDTDLQVQLAAIDHP